MPPVAPQTISPQGMVAPRPLMTPPPKKGGKSIIRFLIIILVVGGLGGVGYKYFLGGNLDIAQNTGDGLVTTAGTGTGTSAVPDLSASGVNTQSSEQIGNDFLMTLLSVRSIKIDSTVFTSQAFTSLQDFSRPLLPDNNPGRPNPFAPLGSDTTTISTQISTSNASAILTTTATFNGTLTIADTSTVRWFEYGASPSLGTTSAKKPQSVPGTFAETVTGLLPNTMYYVKAMALYGGQTISGNVISFKTAQAVR